MRASLRGFGRALCMTAVALLAVGVRTATAVPVITFNEATGSSGTQSDQSIGWQFDVLSPLTVTGLSWYDEGANGLAVAHTVGIWNPSGTLLASVLVPAGTVAPLEGQFRTVAVTPFTLAVGNGYIVGGQNFANSTDRLAFNVTQTVDPRLRYVDATFSEIGTGFTRPATFSTANNGFYGPSFSADIPEPGTGALLAAGLLPLAGIMARRRRRR